MAGVFDLDLDVDPDTVTVGDSDEDDIIEVDEVFNSRSLSFLHFTRLPNL